METIEQTKTLSREQQITNWYKVIFPKACGFVKRRGGDLEDARELFQEALVLYYEKHVKTGFLPEKVEAAYIMGIVKKLWLRKCSSENGMSSIEGIELVTTEENPAPLSQKLIKFLERAGSKCMDLLQSFYYEGLNMKEMSVRFGYGSERSVTVQKYKCLEKVRDEVKQRALGYEDFID